MTLYIYYKYVNFTLLSQRKYAAFIRRGRMESLNFRATMKSVP